MSTSPDTRLEAAARQKAFDALVTYDRGSSRGALQPIDDAVAAATGDAALQADLELRLGAILHGRAPVVAKEYACGKLAVIGGPASVAALAELLPNPELAHAATNALQVMLAPEAAATLRGSLGKLAGLPLVGVITALGMRRDAESAALLGPLLTHADGRVAGAAVAALGEIGSKAAVRLLLEFVPKATPPLRPAVADASLVGAVRLRDAGDPAGARSLLEALLATEPPAHVRAAALRFTR
jgi:HEAT repeat protein